MPREPHIPLFLWVATAGLVHLLGGGGADQAAQVISERLDVQRFASAVRGYVRSHVKPIEVALLTDDELRDPTSARSTNEDEPEVADQQEPDEHAPTANPTEPPELTPKPKPEPPDPEAAARREQTEEKKAEEEEKKAEEVVPPRPPAEMPPVQVKNRVAVEQHVKDENQQDNPEAEFIGDHANHVVEETQARITATDQNDPSPTPGSSHSGPADTPGNSHVTEIAHSDDAAGQPDKAPREDPVKADEPVKKQPPAAEAKGGGNPNADRQHAQLEPKQGQDVGRDRGDTKTKGPEQAAEDSIAASRAETEVPNVGETGPGAFAMNTPRDAQTAQSGRPERARRLPPRRGRNGPLDFLGLGATGTSRGGLNLNLAPDQALASVGRDQLEHEREADGERRRSKHRGSWRSVGLDRWRGAIENYVSSVKPGNQTALNTARVPFAGYLNKIHVRIHPLFADSFLASLDTLPRGDLLNRDDLKTNLEIVLDQVSGKVVKMGVTRSSGSTVFDIAALEAVQSASPFGKAPGVIASSDGNVYLHWEFHRNPDYACSTYFARPYIIDLGQESAPPTIPVPTLPPTRPEEDRQGWRAPAEPFRAVPSRPRHAAR